MALVSTRPARLKAMADAGRAGATSALRLSSDPGRFLSTVQIGITLVGILAGAFSGAALGDLLSAILIENGVSAAVADPLGFGIVIASITYLSLVVGELVPKQLALRNPEAIACAVAPTMTVLSRIAAPAVWLLDRSTKIAFRLLGQSGTSTSTVTEEEIKTMVLEAETAGVLETHEREMIAGVLRLGDRPVRGLMTPRTEVDWIGLDESPAAIRAQLLATPHSRLPVSESDTDSMVGVIQVKDVLAALLTGSAEFDLRSFVRTAPVIPDTVDALDMLKTLRDAAVPMVLVHDEYGHFEGVVTPADVLEVIAGAFRSDSYDEDPDAVRRDDGSWLLAGSMPADEMADCLGLSLPAERGYQTVAGLVLSGLRHLPVTGETVDMLGFRFEVVDMDGRRIDKVLASRTTVD